MFFCVWCVCMCIYMRMPERSWNSLDLELQALVRSLDEGTGNHPSPLKEQYFNHKTTSSFLKLIHILFVLFLRNDLKYPRLTLNLSCSWVWPWISYMPAFIFQTLRLQVYATNGSWCVDWSQSFMCVSQALLKLRCIPALIDESFRDLFWGFVCHVNFELKAHFTDWGSVIFLFCFYLVIFFETGLLCVSLTVLEFTLQTRLA